MQEKLGFELFVINMIPQLQRLFELAERVKPKVYLGSEDHG